MIATLLDKIYPAWDPRTPGTRGDEVREEGEDDIEPLDRRVEKGDETATLAGAITIIGEAEEDEHPHHEAEPEGA